MISAAKAQAKFLAMSGLQAMSNCCKSIGWGDECKIWRENVCKYIKFIEAENDYLRSQLAGNISAIAPRRCFISRILKIINPRGTRLGD